MKNVHNGRGNINVASGGGGTELIGIGVLAIAAWFVMSTIVHILFLLAIAVGILTLSSLAGLGIWVFYLRPRVYHALGYEQHEPYAIRGDYAEPREIENTKVIVMTEQQYEEFLRRER